MKPASIAVYTDGEVIGDGVIKLIFAGALKQALPDTKITWLCGGDSVYTNVLSELANPLIDEIVNIKEGLGGGRQFDLIIDTQHKVLRTLSLRGISHKVFLSPAAHYLFSGKRPPKHARKRGRMIEELMTLGSLAAGTELKPHPITLPGPKWDAAAKQLLPDGCRYVGFVPGAGHPSKRWPLERFLSLAAKVTEKDMAPVFILGPMDSDCEEPIRQALPTAQIPRIEGACLTIALGKRLSAAIANDSGGGHLLAAGGTPLVSLLRSNSVRKKFLPAAPHVKGFTPEDFGGKSMADIPKEPVFQALEEILRE